MIAITYKDTVVVATIIVTITFLMRQLYHDNLMSTMTICWFEVWTIFALVVAAKMLSKKNAKANKATDNM